MAKFINNLIQYTGFIKDNVYHKIPSTEKVTIFGQERTKLGSVLSVEYDLEEKDENDVVLFTLRQRVHLVGFSNLGFENKAEMSLIAENLQPDGTWLVCWTKSPKAANKAIKMATGQRVEDLEAKVQPIYGMRTVMVPNPDFVEGSQDPELIPMQQEDPSQVLNANEVGNYKNGYCSEFEFWCYLLMPALSQSLFPSMIDNIHRHFEIA